MKIKFALLPAVAFCFLFSGTIARAQQSSKEQKIYKLLEITNASVGTDKMLAQIQDMMTAQLPPGLPPEQVEKMDMVMGKAMGFVKEHLGVEKLHPQFVAIYRDIYTEEELDGLLAFYQSPTGKVMLEKMPVVMEKTMTLMQSEMMKLLPEMQKMLMESMRGTGPIQ